MADRKISELTALSSANLQDIDLLPIVDFDTTNSDSSPANASKQTKSITIGDLKTSIFSSPTFTGNPTSSTAPTNANHLTNKTYVDTEISTVIGTAGDALNTLGELSDALNDDENFASTIATSLGEKAPLANPSFTGNVGIGTSTPDSLLHLDGGSNNVEMILETHNNGVGRISFGDDSDNDIGQIAYTHANNALTIKTNATDAITIDSSQNTTFTGKVESTSSVARPIQNNEGNDTPIRAIERLTQAQYDALTGDEPRANTLYIIV